jgi:HSP20 family protein
MDLIKHNRAWDPFDLVTDLQTDLNRMFNRSLTKKSDWLRGFEPSIEVHEEANSFIVSADLPGLRKDDFKISVDGSRLTLSGERKEVTEKKEKGAYFSEKLYGAFQRAIELPADVDAGKAKATYKDGVLRIELPKSENAKPKQISVDVQ